MTSPDYDRAELERRLQAAEQDARNMRAEAEAAQERTRELNRQLLDSSTGRAEAENKKLKERLEGAILPVAALDLPLLPPDGHWLLVINGYEKLGISGQGRSSRAVWMMARALAEARGLNVHVITHDGDDADLIERDDYTGGCSDECCR